MPHIQKYFILGKHEQSLTLSCFSDQLRFCARWVPSANSFIWHIPIYTKYICTYKKHDELHREFKPVIHVTPPSQFYLIASTDKISSGNSGALLSTPQHVKGEAIYAVPEPVKQTTLYCFSLDAFFVCLFLFFYTPSRGKRGRGRGKRRETEE